MKIILLLLLLLWGAALAPKLIAAPPPHLALPGDQNQEVIVAHYPKSLATRNSILRQGLINVFGRDTLVTKGSPYFYEAKRKYGVEGVPPLFFKVPKSMIGFADASKGWHFEYDKGLGIFNPLPINNGEKGIIPSQYIVFPTSEEYQQCTKINPNLSPTSKEVERWVRTDIAPMLHSMGMQHYNIPAIGRLQETTDFEAQGHLVKLAPLALGTNWQERLRAMKAGDYPLAFSSKDQYQLFMQELLQILKKHDLRGDVGVRGSSTTLISNNPFKGASPANFHNYNELKYFDSQGKSDVDILMNLPRLSVAMHASGAGLTQSRDVFLSSSTPNALPDLNDFKRKWENILQREVNFSVLSTLQDKYEMHQHPFTESNIHHFPIDFDLPVVSKIMALQNEKIQDLNQFLHTQQASPLNFFIEKAMLSSFCPNMNGECLKNLLDEFFGEVLFCKHQALTEVDKITFSATVICPPYLNNQLITEYLSSNRDQNLIIKDQQKLMQFYQQDLQNIQNEISPYLDLNKSIQGWIKQRYTLQRAREEVWHVILTSETIPLQQILSLGKKYFPSFSSNDRGLDFEQWFAKNHHTLLFGSQDAKNDLLEIHSLLKSKNLDNSFPNLQTLVHSIMMENMPETDFLKKLLALKQENKITPAQANVIYKDYFEKHPTLEIETSYDRLAFLQDNGASYDEVEQEISFLKKQNIYTNIDGGNCEKFAWESNKCFDTLFMQLTSYSLEAQGIPVTIGPLMRIKSPQLKTELIAQQLYHDATAGDKASIDKAMVKRFGQGIDDFLTKNSIAFKDFSSLLNEKILERDLIKGQDKLSLLLKAQKELQPFHLNRLIAKTLTAAVTTSNEFPVDHKMYAEIKKMVEEKFVPNRYETLELLEMKYLEYLYQNNKILPAVSADYKFLQEHMENIKKHPTWKNEFLVAFLQKNEPSLTAKKLFPYLDLLSLDPNVQADDSNSPKAQIIKMIFKKFTEKYNPTEFEKIQKEFFEEISRLSMAQRKELLQSYLDYYLVERSYHSKGLFKKSEKRSISKEEWEKIVSMQNLNLKTELLAYFQKKRP
ncbi:MAG: hypothetical protein HQK50_07915 [Oligoflexia bacterium]|nr:hypothetical protein [Oligoflexia bacterium]MBF0365483.1 hypothetical protein [Oligoflexia bacterium]